MIRRATCSRSRAAVQQLDVEQRAVGARGAGRELQVHLEQAVLAAAGVHLDVEVDLRLVLAGTQGVGRARVLHREVADELGEDADAGLTTLDRRRSGAGVGFAHDLPKFSWFEARSSRPFGPSG